MREDQNNFVKRADLVEMVVKARNDEEFSSAPEGNVPIIIYCTLAHGNAQFPTLFTISGQTSPLLFHHQLLLTHGDESGFVDDPAKKDLYQSSSADDGEP
ncbi:hypothetical protein TrVFT333_010449 [Trichoderma virens FT-333]|nr:hypothetical protein TrVFT333_010449 [Trichoderma virens FT-333]